MFEEGKMPSKLHYSRTKCKVSCKTKQLIGVYRNFPNSNCVCNDLCMYNKQQTQTSKYENV